MQADVSGEDGGWVDRAAGVSPSGGSEGLESAGARELGAGTFDYIKLIVDTICRLFYIRVCTAPREHDPLLVSRRLRRRDDRVSRGDHA